MKVLYRSKDAKTSVPRPCYLYSLGYKLGRSEVHEISSVMAGKTSKIKRCEMLVMEQ